MELPTNAELEAWKIKRAKGGDVEIARGLLMDAALAMDRGCPSRRLTAYLANCLVAASCESANANKAFNLVGRTRGRRRSVDTGNAQRLAAAYFLLLKAGCKSGKAKAKIQTLFRVGARRVEQAAKEWKPMKSQDADTWLALAGGWRRQLWSTYEKAERNEKDANARKGAKNN